MDEDLTAFARERLRGGSGAARWSVVWLDLADRAVAVQMGRMMGCAVASMEDRGQIPSKDATAVKPFSSEATQAVAQPGIRPLGPAGQLAPGSKWTPLARRIARSNRTAVAPTIGGRTSEIQRNVIAMRGLGLPRG